MQEENNNNFSNLDNKINLNEIFFVLIKGKKYIIFSTIILFLAGIVYSLYLPNIYQSRALLAPVEESSLLGESLSQISGLASFAGINLSGDNKNTNSKKAIEMMESLNFFENHILPKIFLPDLMALKSWEPKKNILHYDESIYQQNSDEWVRDFSFPNKLIPSAQESHEVFNEEHFNLNVDNRTGYVKLSVKHQSPYVAKQWIEIIFNEINYFYRQKDKAEAEKSVNYLKNQMAKTSFSEVKQATASLLQKEIQILTLIEANKDYVFEYVYPPDVMEEKSEPSRIFIISFMTLLGIFSGALIVFFKHYFTEKKKTLEITVT